MAETPFNIKAHKVNMAECLQKSIDNSDMKIIKTMAFDYQIAGLLPTLLKYKFTVEPYVYMGILNYEITIYK